MRHQERTRQFEKQTFDVTSQCERYCRCICCPCVGLSTTKLELGPDEAVLTKHDCCNHIVQKRPYAQLGSVDSHHECGICWSVGSDLTGRDGRLMPGWGCNAPLVREIVEELQERKLGRGNVAQMRSHEDLAASVATPTPNSTQSSLIWALSLQRRRRRRPQRRLQSHRCQLQRR